MINILEMNNFEGPVIYQDIINEDNPRLYIEVSSNYYNGDNESEYVRVFLDNHNGVKYRFVNISLYEPSYCGSDIEFSKTKFTKDELLYFIRYMNSNRDKIIKSLYNEYSNPLFKNSKNEYIEAGKYKIKPIPEYIDYSTLETII